MPQSKPTFSNGVWASGGAIVDPGSTKTTEGWTVEIPTHQNFNWWQNRADEMLVHLNEQGVASWDASTDYPVGAHVKGSDGVLYVSLTTPNVNQDPTTDSGANWVYYRNRLGVAKNLLDFIPRALHADILDYSSTDDITVYLQAALDASKALVLPPGLLNCSSVDTGICQYVVGHGVNTRIVTTTNAAVISINSNDVKLQDFVIEGDYVIAGGASTKPLQVGIYNQGWYGFRYENIIGYKLGGYLTQLRWLFSDTSTYTRMGIINNCSAKACNGGLWFDDRGEYATVVGGTYEKNNTGMLIGAGNILVNGANINHNDINVNLITGINDGHGVLSGCNINHATTWNILATDLVNGMTFDGCHIYEGNIWLLDSKGIHITNGDLDVAGYLFEGCTALIKNNLMPEAYGNVITNDRNSNASYVRWIDNYNLEGQKFGPYGPYDGGYAKASNTSSIAIASDQDVIFDTVVNRVTNHNGFDYYELYNTSTGVFTYRGIGSGQVKVNLMLNVLNVADATTTNVYVQKNGVDYKIANKIITGTNVRFTLDTSIPCDVVGDTIKFRIYTTDAGGVDISSTGNLMQVEGL